MTDQEQDTLPTVEKTAPRGPQLHPAFYIGAWIFFSNTTILFNKWLLDTAGFRYPIILTTFHLFFACLATQILARTNPSLLNVKAVRMTGRIYLRNVVPIGILYSGSLVCSNLVYLYLSVAYIQMLKAGAPVAVLFISWLWGVQNPSLRKLLNVLLITAGVALTSVGELQFSFVGFIYQIAGIVFEGLRIVLIEVLVSGRGADDGNAAATPGLQKMDPLVTLYYYAPVCMVANFIVALFTELPRLQFADLQKVGLFILMLNAVVAFLLNVSSVFLIGRTSAVVLTLTGILKNVLLVFVSMAIYGTSITVIQWFGYSIAVVGLIYYSFGPEGMAKFFEWCSSTYRGAGTNNEGIRLARIRRGVVLLWRFDESIVSQERRKTLIWCLLCFITAMLIIGTVYGGDSENGRVA